MHIIVFPSQWTSRRNYSIAGVKTLVHWINANKCKIKDCHFKANTVMEIFRHIREQHPFIDPSNFGTSTPNPTALENSPSNIGPTHLSTVHSISDVKNLASEYSGTSIPNHTALENGPSNIGLIISQLFI